MQLLKYFHELTLHPANAKQLKSLILQLAVQGKLTAQWRKENPDVEPAAKLLERVKDFNAQQLLNKKRKLKTPNIDDNDDVELYDNWTKAYNFELFSLLKGKNPKDLSETEKKFPYLDIEALDRGNVRRYSNDEKAPKCTEFDILVVCDGSRSGLVLDGKSGIVGSTLAIIETPIEIQDFVKLFFLQSFEKYNSTMKGAAIPHLDTQKILAESIGLPPLEEQKAIVETVDRLFKEVEQLEQLTESRIRIKEQYAVSALRSLAENNTPQEWEALQPHFHSFFNHTPNIKKLRETILQLAVQGKLTARWRKVHPELVEGKHHAALLLQKIKAEKARLIAEGKIKKEKPLPEITPEEIPYELPEGWVWCRLGEIIKISSGNSLTSNDMVKNGRIPVYGGNGITGYHNNFNVSKKTIVIGRVGYYCGSIHLTEEKAWVTDNAFITQFSESNIYQDFLFWMLKGTNLKENENATAQPVISGRRVYPILIAIPPFLEQQAIVSNVNRLMALCDSLEQEVASGTARAELWMKGAVREVVGE